MPSDTFTWLPAAYLASEWAIRVLMTPIVVRRRSSSNALGWLAIIYFLPWIGLIFYGLVGQRYLGRARMNRHIDAKRRVETPAVLALRDEHATHPAISPDQDDLVQLCERLTTFPILGGNAVDLIADTDAFIDALIADIERAENHVHLLAFIYKDDSTGRRVADALMRAAARGVACRVVADSVGSKSLFFRLARELRRGGVEVIEALPAGILRRQLRRLDLRNHRKVVVIDGRVSYTGSQNIVDADYGHNKVGAWRDIMMRIEGAGTLGVQTVFLEDWCAETGVVLDSPDIFPPPARASGAPIQIVPSGPSDRTGVFHSVIVAAIHEAQRRVTLTTPYFIPDDSLLLALRLAALRGVRVEVVVPRKSDQWFVGLAAESFFSGLIEDGVRLFRFEGGLLHAKTLSVDDSFALVGSGNLDSRSFFLNFELSVILYGSEVTGRLRVEQETYIGESSLLTAEEWRRQPGWMHTVRSTAALAGPLL